MSFAGRGLSRCTTRRWTSLQRSYDLIRIYTYFRPNSRQNLESEPLPSQTLLTRTTTTHNESRTSNRMPRNRRKSDDGNSIQVRLGNGREKRSYPLSRRRKKGSIILRGHPSPDINEDERDLPRSALCTLSQLRSDYSIIVFYRESTSLFSTECQTFFVYLWMFYISTTTLTLEDLWTNPKVASFLCLQ